MKGSLCGAWILFAGILFVINPVTGQDQKSEFARFDRMTYQQFLDKNWDSLIVTARQAIKKDVDYFYLRQRLGIAYYEKKNYLLAARSFERSLQFNSGDPTSREYLAWSYLYLNRVKEAGLLKGKGNKPIPGVPEKKGPVSFIFVSPGVSFSDNFRHKKMGNPEETSQIYSEMDLMGNSGFLQAGIQTEPLKRVTSSIGYTGIVISKLKKIRTFELYKSGYDTVETTGGYYVDTIYSYSPVGHEENYNLIQNQFYLNAAVHPGKGFVIIPAVHVLRVGYNTVYAKGKRVEYFAQSYDTIPSEKYVYTFENRDTSFLNAVVSLGIYKHISTWKAGVTATWSDLNGKEQYQAGGVVTWFPRGNLDLYATLNGVASSEADKFRWIISLEGGMKAYRDIWCEASVSFGRMVNHNLDNAFLIYNSGDESGTAAGLKGIWPISPRLQLSLIWKYQVHYGYLVHYTDFSNFDIVKREYHNHLIAGGLKWNLLK